MFNRPEDTYNGLVDPASLLRAWRNHADKRWASEVLQPIGHGDGGGGPTAEMIVSQKILADFPLLADDPLRQRQRHTSSAPRPRPWTRRSRSGPASSISNTTAAS